MKLEKTNINGLYKDKKSNVIVNRNQDELTLLKAGHQQSKEIVKLRTEIEILKRQVTELMKLLNE